MLGYISPAEAVFNEYTHSGSYYKLPVYYRWDEQEELWVMTKLSWLMWLLHTLMFLEAFFADLMQLDIDPAFIVTGVISEEYELKYTICPVSECDES